MTRKLVKPEVNPVKTMGAIEPVEAQNGIERQNRLGLAGEHANVDIFRYR